jgi:hypothetical protein
MGFRLVNVWADKAATALQAAVAVHARKGNLLAADALRERLATLPRETSSRSRDRRGRD